MTYLEEENDKIRIQLDDCQWHKEKNEENLDRISEAVDFTINKCKVFFKKNFPFITIIQTCLEIWAGNNHKQRASYRILGGSTIKSSLRNSLCNLSH